MARETSHLSWAKWRQVYFMLDHMWGSQSDLLSSPFMSKVEAGVLYAWSHALACGDLSLTCFPPLSWAKWRQVYFMLDHMRWPVGISVWPAFLPFHEQSGGRCTLCLITCVGLWGSQSDLLSSPFMSKVEAGVLYAWSHALACGDLSLTYFPPLSWAKWRQVYFMLDHMRWPVGISVWPTFLPGARVSSAGEQPTGAAVPGGHATLPASDDPHHQHQGGGADHHSDCCWPLLRMDDHGQVMLGFELPVNDHSHEKLPHLRPWSGKLLCLHFHVNEQLLAKDHPSFDTLFVPLFHSIISVKTNLSIKTLF